MFDAVRVLVGKVENHAKGSGRTSAFLFYFIGRCVNFIRVCKISASMPSSEQRTN